MRVLFLGTPDFAIPSLSEIYASSHEIIGVVTQPDKPGKHLVMTPPPVKIEAEKLGLTVYQFDRISREGVELVRSLAPDIMVTAAFGQILSRELLSIPKYGVFNVHASLLPKYRGSSPIQACLLNGDDKTGVTIMKTAYEVDSGDIVLAREIAITEADTAGTLFDKLALLGAKSIVEALDFLEKGEVTYTPQDHSRATFCKMITKADAEIKKEMSAQEVLYMIRAYDPWPVAYLVTKEGRLRLFGGVLSVKKGEVGSFYTDDGELYLNLSEGAIRLSEVQPDGKKRMTGREYLLGHKSILESALL